MSVNEKQKPNYTKIIILSIILLIPVMAIWWYWVFGCALGGRYSLICNPIPYMFFHAFLAYCIVSVELQKAIFKKFTKEIYLAAFLPTIVVSILFILYFISLKIN